MIETQRATWHNWSGSVWGQPRDIVKPTSIEGLARMIGSYARDGRHVRVVGAGHSFTPLVQTDDILMSLEHIQGIEAIDAERDTVTVLGGTTLRRLGDELFQRGLSQENLGDIDVQSIAGAISTGTHGTGVGLGTLSTQIEGLTLVTANGELLECSNEQHPEIFKAAQVSLGALGVIAKVRLRVVPARRLQYRVVRAKLDDILAHLEQHKQENTHFEFFWFPYSPYVQAKFLNATEAPQSKGTIWGELNKIVLENWLFWLFSECARMIPRLSKGVCQLSGMSISPVEEVNYSHRLYATPRLVRFNEMEYNISAEHVPAVFEEIRACINQYQFNVSFPLECRFVRADDIWLSPAYRRASSYIAVHMYRGMPYQAYFRQIEQIFQRYEGRPHWGKLHTLDAKRLAALYPRWHDFRRVRASLDPQGIFLNDYLRRLFDVDAPVTSVQESPHE